MVQIHSYPRSSVLQCLILSHCRVESKFLDIVGLVNCRTKYEKRIMRCSNTGGFFVENRNSEQREEY